ncbi:MAG TPA: SagB/ThcOx family dehydrogenase [Tepidisphaeraceae bacterium]|jgi:SagB-type dehydrogenase family enzyme|nr:SagB/ThcOx family dehydrogenase [Tepidisphaeraceae bacterium]
MHPRKLPRDILERVDRVMEYHRSTKLTATSVRAQPTVLDPATKPSAYRCFDDQPAIPLPTTLLDAPVPALAVLSEGLTAVPESQVHPSQDIKTLASWLYLADGLSAKHDASVVAQSARTCPSAGSLYPYEIYVAAFGIEGLEPGLYHYNVRDFSLCKLREGPETLSTIKRGRPDLNFLKSMPAVLLVSTIFWRSAWRYRQRGYRMALLDAGHLVQNIVAAGNGLGIQTMPRFQIHDKTMRELIGVPAGTDFDGAECVQAMVVWANEAKKPLADSSSFLPRPALPRIKRSSLSQNHVPYGSILATHEDCIAPGVAVREIRPPLTELSPVFAGDLSPAPPYAQPLEDGPSIRQMLMSRRSTRTFAERPITRDQFLAINRLAFRGGSVFPLTPDGPHVALLRPYWINHLVAGMDSGVWYYDPIGDNLACISRGDFHAKSAYLCVEQKICGQAAAVCFLMADLKRLTTGAGPDAYRLAHLEAGLMAQRVYLAANSIGLGCCGIGAFYDDEVRNFLGLMETSWEAIYALAAGIPAGRVQ